MNHNTDPREKDPINNEPEKQQTGSSQEEDIRIPDLDGDGIIGHTGGNFGDTTYTGGSLIQPQPGPVEEAPDADEEYDEEK